MSYRKISEKKKTKMKFRYPKCEKKKLFISLPFRLKKKKIHNYLLRPNRVL